ncbi:TetR/AcrR family transcriptional regulator [Actinotalea sp. M2MS4P-6]|uniref:TetR/AcrR family transcriptional regulator n=1 Tax=Actinotalea sp. M2MS4P-6 TaxID=2983762 RepID=UPI0021E39328|nr:TetR/AcrR family transcriptional regulator [Actinotalea sp. M2MS4P-6]MCV2395752.1 TetR/AcrR family transcriptional regulator [Actinotalea sp. M2MS4P-6]
MVGSGDRTGHVTAGTRTKRDPGLAERSTTPGRRERSKQDKRDRIFSAAAELFAERGFENVTTQAIADRADVGTGTVFRYAATKGELFLMVFNERLAAAVAEGAGAAADEPDVTRAVCALVEPVLTWGHDLGDAADYQRELLFGPPTERYRAEGLQIVADLELRITERLLSSAGTTTPAARQGAERAARTVFAVLNLLLVQPLNGLHPGTDPGRELRAQVAQVVRGFLLSAAGPDTAATGDVG